MCYFNGVKVTFREYIRLTSLETILDGLSTLDRILHDGFTYSEYPIVLPVDGGKGIIAEEAIWGFLPPISSLQTVEDIPEFRKRYVTLDAKGETILTSPFFKEAARKRRCLILSSGFYDWRSYKPEGAKKELKYPYYITLPDREYFYMAGIWSPFTDRATGETFKTFSMITTAANSLMAQVHNIKQRMPTILPEELALEWIQDGLGEARIRELATYQYRSESMQAVSIRKDFKQLPDPTEAFEYSELPSIVLAN